MRIHIFILKRLNVAKYVLKNGKVEIIDLLQNKPNTAKTPFKSKKFKKNQKQSLSEDSNYLLWDVFVLSKITFLEVFFCWFWRQNQYPYLAPFSLAKI